MGSRAPPWILQGLQQLASRPSRQQSSQLLQAPMRHQLVGLSLLSRFQVGNGLLMANPSLPLGYPPATEGFRHRFGNLGAGLGSFALTFSLE